ncbi:MAG TPA: hypothetical protein VFA33_09720 [Bryobacteraceae bacterium]|nr:hypothetical protein [Bryobacteraceae bacterium]
MTRERTARLLTVGVLVVLSVAVLARKAGWEPSDFSWAGVMRRAEPKPEPSPQDAIYAMLDAARAGDVRRYLASYAGQMQAAVQQSATETGEARFAQYLKDSNAPVKGIAISEPQALSDREVKVRVEYVYQDRNEAQVMYLEKLAAGWKITRVDGAERVKTLVPYGTPVE